MYVHVAQLSNLDLSLSVATLAWFSNCGLQLASSATVKVSSYSSSNSNLLILLDAGDRCSCGMLVSPFDSDWDMHACMATMTASVVCTLQLQLQAATSIAVACRLAHVSTSVSVAVSSYMLLCKPTDIHAVLD